jgi:hypothetical protein
MTLTPTAEQDHAVAQARTGRSLAAVAGARTGKTTTLVLLAEALAGKACRYLAFNKAIVADSARRFPPNVVCSTAHSLAFAATGKAFRRRLDSPRLPSAVIAERLTIGPLTVSYGGEARPLSAGYLAGVTMRAVKNFAHSADPEPSVAHVPYIDGIDPPAPDGTRGWGNNREIRAFLLPAVRRAWADLCDPKGTLTYHHDYYLKAYQLTTPTIDAEVVMVDEAQDLSPVLADIVAHQGDAQLILVGDPYQSIYGWLGATDAMNAIDVDARCYLTKSFRFGPAVAAVANNLLGRLGADLRLRGHPGVHSAVGPIGDPRTLLTRTNAEAVRQLLHHLEAGHVPALVGGTGEVASFCRAAIELGHGGRTGHRDLACFASWAQVVDYVAGDAQGGELKLLVDLVESFGARTILAALARADSEDRADVVISTAHKSKGREWDSVTLTGDYTPPKAGQENSAEELRLLYVAVTRARHHLDIRHVPRATRHPTPTRT